MIQRISLDRAAGLFAVIAVASFFMGSPRVVDAQTPTSITLISSMTCGKNPNAKVNLSGPAPAGGLVIQVSSSIPSAASVPASVTAPAGASSASFLITCVQVAQSMAVIVSATAGGATQTALINVLPPVLSHITVDPVSGATVDPFSAGSRVNARATLDAPAPPGGQLVTLLKSGPIGVPQSVMVPAGAASATFSVLLPPVAQPTPATITGTAGVTKSVELTLLPPSLSALVFETRSAFASSRTVTGGDRQRVLVTLGGRAPAGGLTVQLSSSNTAAAPVPATMTVSQGDTAAFFLVLTLPVAQASPVTLTASVGGVSKSGVLTVAVPALEALGVLIRTVIGGQSLQGRVLLPAFNPAPPGGLPVQLSSNNTPIALVPPSVTVPAGANMADFNIATFPTERPINVTITASAGGVTRTEQITVIPEGPTSLTIAPKRVLGGIQSQGTLSALASNDAFVVSLSSNNPLVVTIPRSVSFAPGVTAQHFTITTTPVAQPTSVTISATTTSGLSNTALVSRPGPAFTVTRTDVLDIDPPKITGFTISRPSVVGGSSTLVTGTVTLNGPALPGFPVTVSIDTVAFLPPNASSSVPFQSGGATWTFSIIAGRVQNNTTVTIRVSNGGVSKTATLQVNQP